MNRFLLVAWQEYSFNIRRPAFLAAALGIPAFMAILALVVGYIAIQNETDLSRVGQVGYIDQAGLLTSELDAPFVAYTDEAAARADLDSGELGAYFVVAADYMESGSVQLYSTTGFPDALDEAIETALLDQLSTGTTLAERINDPVNLMIRALDTNRTLPQIALIGVLFAPLVLVFVLFFAIQISSTYLMAGIVEEKTNRVMEMLVTSVTPFQLLFGKILGLGLLGLTQVAIWLGLGGVVIALTQNSDVLAGLRLPVDLVLIALVFFVFGYLLYASLLGAIGVLVGSEQESRQIAGLFVFMMVLPFIFFTLFLLDPNGTIPVILSLVPFTAPVSIVLRLAFGAVPLWQVAASLALLIATTVGIIWAAARLFRWAMLRYGKPFRLRNLVRGLRRKNTLAEDTV